MGRMDGRAAVITGASGGIGWATAKRYVAEGAAVIAADIDDERGAEMVADIGGAVTYVHCDVTDP
jgi:NAD(P)-dependent dehydrogenase (short-subunit alcohol dehydrogenase family)